MKKRKLVFGLLVVFILFIGIFIGSNLNFEERIKEKEQPQKQIFEDFEGKKVEVWIVGINQEGKGVPSKLITRVREGEGDVLVNINNVLTGETMQYSARLAAEVASDITNKSLENLDVTYSIESGNISLIDGPSAGSVMAVSTISLLEGKDLNDDVVMTGSINKNGELESASGIMQKAEAAKEINASLFLIPESSIITDKYVKERKCGSLNGNEYCEIDYVPEEVDLGIEIKKIKNVEEALKYYYEEE